MTADAGSAQRPPRRRYRPVIGPRLKPLLWVVFGLFALLAVNSFYLSGVRVAEAATGETYQNWFYISMFLLHLAVGALFVLPVIWFGLAHMRNARTRPNRRAVKVGYALFGTALVLLFSGIVLTRIEGVITVNDPTVRGVAYWLHVLTPLVAAWLFVVHRLAGKRINWRIGGRVAAAAVVLVGVALVLQFQDPRAWNVEGPASGEQYFFPSLARTASGGFIPEQALSNDAYCLDCHGDIHDRWAYSAHRFSSFNNPAYSFSVQQTRDKAYERSGDVQASRFCAGCHDPVVFFSGAFDDPDFDIDQPAAHAGITCTSCHAITHINSPRGNADYTIEEPQHYPFAFSDSGVLRFVNHQLVKAKPELHKRTFLKPLHTTSEFCGSCHKVHLPEELNHYKFLRGQNHYDSHLLSGVSGHGVASFYYPPKAEPNCNGCHMELLPSEDFGSRRYPESEQPEVTQVHDHLFPSANTGIPHLLDFPDWVIEAHREFNEGVVDVDIFGVKPGGTIEDELIAPLRPEVPALEPGEDYLLEVVVRTLGLGHHLTQGTADSNQLWLDVEVRDEHGNLVGRSGGLGEGNRVDPWSHFINVYMLDRDGARIDRRNAEDIFVPLYDHQIPPGAGDVVHYGLEVPASGAAALTVEATLRYRKFDTTYLRHIYGPETANELPILDLARDSVTFQVGGSAASDADAPSSAASAREPGKLLWQRWNDYGIGLLRKGGTGRGELRQAIEAFTRVEELGRPDGPLNLARVYLAQGTVRDDAIAALERAAAFDPPAPSWSVAWFSGLVNLQNGAIDDAISNFRSILEADSEEMRRRGFDFSRDVRLHNELGLALFERAKRERGPARTDTRAERLREARESFDRALVIDPENVTAHYNLGLIHAQLGDSDSAVRHRELHARYKPDDNARDRAIAIARRADAAADHAAEAIVIYDLHRPERFEGSRTGVAGGGG
ncbi:MAG: tetratricopeptide repeat protein [Holophagales bacterium]|nr:tetratricopeptide repeat protein [Holophagales bacterium]MYD23712.1 tetratricopeptide repeat protein [Holophagales bacterium]MYI33395.1 tetratricopeptide repeat protein [Holophagales bacterium]